VSRLGEAVRAVGWYLREVTGEGDYDRYLAHHACTHQATEPLSRREFERRRMDGRERDPGVRCC
jgi:uncharacterized short protein YbdD (DUF466 family)